MVLPGNGASRDPRLASAGARNAAACSCAPRLGRYRSEKADQRQHVAYQRPEDPMGQHVGRGPAKQRLRRQERPAERSMLDPGRDDPVNRQQARQQQGVHPQEVADDESRQDSRPARPLPVQRRHQCRRELRDRREGQQPDRREAGRRRHCAVVDVGQQQHADDGRPSNPEHQASGGPAAGRSFRPVAPDQRQQEIVTDHGRKRDAGDDDHAGCGGEAADVGDQCERLVASLQRQPEHEAVARHPGPCGGEAERGDRHDQGADQHQVAGEHPARLGQVARIRALDDPDLELTGKAEDRREGEQHLGDEAREQLVLDRQRPRRGHVLHGSAERHQREHADRDEGQQLHQGLDGYRQHQARMMLGRVDAARAEEDCKQGEHDRHVERAVVEPRTAKPARG